MSELAAEERPVVEGAGWLAFAGTVLVMSGLFKLFDALWAFKYDDDIAEPVQTVLFENDLASWGWVWLVVGVFLILTGFAVVNGASWARWVGIVVATFSAVTFMPWIYFKPLWAILSISLCVMAIYALTLYGGYRSNRS